jgi:hypothetical protein
MSKFNAGNEAQYAELPYPVNYLYWKRGNAQLAHLKDTDPAAFFGGWSASVKTADGDLPALPLPRVTRTSDDGSATFERYSTNVLTFLPIAHRLRFELRQKTVNVEGREEEKVIAISREYVSGHHKGYQPHKQVFGIVYDAEMKVNAYAVLKLNKWSSYISFGKAESAWMKIKVNDNQALIRRYGSIGITNKNGVLVPLFEEFNKGRSTPIEAIDTVAPFVIPVTPELDEIWEQAQEWAKCERWNAVGTVAAENEPIAAPIEPDFGAYPDEA